MTNSMQGDGAFAVITRGISKQYRRAVALSDVNLRVPDGSVYVLIGANGAGKSTTLKILLNLERANAGSAEVFGFDTVARAADARAQIGYVPEHHRQVDDWMTCGRLLGYAAAYYPSWDHGYATHLGDAFALELDRKVSALSKGEVRRLQLTLALAHRPPLLLLDEPTDGLDPVVRKRTLTLLAEHLADTPTTVLISTHHIHELESLADHVGVLREGRLVAQMPRETLQRTVRRYRIEVPEGWQAPPEIQGVGMRRSSAGREVEVTVVGEERDVVEHLTRTGAHTRDVTSLGLEDAALAFLMDEVTQ